MAKFINEKKLNDLGSLVPRPHPPSPPMGHFGPLFGSLSTVDVAQTPLATHPPTLNEPGSLSFFHLGILPWPLTDFYRIFQLDFFLSCSAQGYLQLAHIRLQRVCARLLPLNLEDSRSLHLVLQFWTFLLPSRFTNEFFSYLLVWNFFLSTGAHSHIQSSDISLPLLCAHLLLSNSANFQSLGLIMLIQKYLLYIRFTNGFYSYLPAWISLFGFRVLCHYLPICYALMPLLITSCTLFVHKSSGSSPRRCALATKARALVAIVTCKLSRCRVGLAGSSCLSRCQGHR